MTDIITTLHPENDENINLYPNIKKENIPDASITTPKIVDASVTTSKIVDKSVTGEKIADGSIGSEKLSSESFDETIRSWLDTHPEATTTVEDGSLTIIKFSNQLKNQTQNDYVTPEMYGAVGDGITDDTQAFINAMNSGKNIEGIKGKTYKANITITKSNFCLSNCDIKGSITFSNGLRFVSITHCNINASGNDYGIYTASNVTKLYIDDVYITSANVCAMYLYNCWDAIVTRVSLSDSAMGFYAYQFNNGTFLGTCYGNTKGMLISGSTSCTIFGTIQENKETGVELSAVHGSLFRLYLEQNGYEGTTIQTQCQMLIGNQEASCIGNDYVIYAIGGSGSDMESKYGVVALDSRSSKFVGYLIRHIDTGLRFGSYSKCNECDIVDTTHVDYGYDKTAIVYKMINGTVQSNTILTYPYLNTKFIIIPANASYKYAFEARTSTQYIIRVYDENNSPVSTNVSGYWTYNGIRKEK